MAFSLHLPKGAPEEVCVLRVAHIALILKKKKRKFILVSMNYMNYTSVPKGGENGRFLPSQSEPIPIKREVRRTHELHQRGSSATDLQVWSEGLAVFG